MNDTKEKRVITPHKGGRTARFECRINPDVKKTLYEIAKDKGVSPADLIEKWTLKNNTKKQ